MPKQPKHYVKKVLFGYGLMTLVIFTTLTIIVKRSKTPDNFEIQETGL